MYVNDSDQYPEEFKSWETEVLDIELARTDVVGWLRNHPRKAWSLTIPFDKQGLPAPFFPDFLIVRSAGDGFVIDILDPHATSYADAVEKARGLATYAHQHGLSVGRVLLVVKVSDALIQLDLSNQAIRESVLTLKSNDQLDQLFKNMGTPIRG